MNLYQTILVAADLTTHSTETLKKAKVLAERLGSKLYLIHVVEPLPISAYSFMSDVSGIERQMLDEASQKMLKIGQQCGVPETQQYVEAGIPKQIIFEKIAEIKADLLVIGSHTKKSVHHLLGSTASSIINSAKCDVIVVPFVENQVNIESKQSCYNAI